jgi:hypothetical protein
MKIRYISDPMTDGCHICYTLTVEGWGVDPSVYGTYTLREVCAFREAAMRKDPSIEMILIYKMTLIYNGLISRHLPVAILTKD